MEKHERNIYLDNKDLSEAIDILKSISLGEIRKEKADVCDALNRVSAEPIFACVSSPFYNSSAMDGICVCFEKTMDANEKRPLRLKKNIDFEYVNTGDVIRQPFNGVIMIEDIVEIDEETIEIYEPCSPWQHIRNIGEDIVASELIIPAFHKIRAVDIGALLAGGVRELEVIKRPVVAVVPTGSEIIDYTEDVDTGKIIDSNSRMFEAMIKEAGGECERYAPVRDDYELIKKTVKEACAKSDIVVIGAGSSAGSKDYTKKVIEELGELLLHGVSIKPGKPTVIGKIDNKCVFGIPGYPVSSYFAFNLFVISAMDMMLHAEKKTKRKVKAVLTSRVYSSLKHLEFVRIKLGRVSGKLVASPLSRGAGVTMSLVNADGVLRVPKNSEGYETGELVEVELLKDIQYIDNTLVSIGSHDVMLDILNNRLHKQKRPANLSSSHVGSMGGVLALKSGKCHIAPIHLLDEKTGEYNLSAIEKYLNNFDCVLIKGVKRTQGIMYRKDFKHKIESKEILRNEDVVFVNRQKGSGTRILVDYLLKNEDIDPKGINGYRRELNTHMMVASAVKSGSADIGIGVLSAAKAMDLEFLPIGYEEYDFIARKDVTESEMFKCFLDCLKSDEFESELKKLGGYSLENTGQIVEI